MKFVLPPFLDSLTYMFNDFTNTVSSSTVTVIDTDLNFVINHSYEAEYIARITKYAHRTHLLVIKRHGFHDVEIHWGTKPHLAVIIAYTAQYQQVVK